MIHLLFVICIPYIAYWLKNTKWALTLSAKLKETWTEGKPFNCPFCLAFWLSASTYWLFAPHVLVYFMVCLTCAIFAWIIEINMKYK